MSATNELVTATKHRLDRMFNARSVAIVGASETGMRARHAIEAMADRDVALHLVNRRGEDVMGRVTHRSLADLAAQGIDVDAAMIFTNKNAAIDVAAEAAAAGVGGVIVNAGGFAEAGPEGVELQGRLTEAAGSMPLIGPNCNGIVAPGLGLHLAGSPPGFPIAAGRIAVVTHSGGTIMPMGIAGLERRFGYSYLVSTGNEAVVDMAEVVEYLATEPSTDAICLQIETIRNPPRFWDAVDQAIAAGKPVLALKVGRSARGQALAKSHTGAVTGAAWMYETALRQHGVIVAADMVDLADRATLFGQVLRSRWSPVRGLAIASSSGGGVTIASDVCADEGIDLPALGELQGQIAEVIPGTTVANPLDLTGAAMTDPNVMTAALHTLVDSDQVDTVFIQTIVSGAAGESFGGSMDSVLEVAAETDALLILGSIEGGPIGGSMDRYLDGGVAVTRGMRAAVRALRSMADFLAFTPPIPPEPAARRPAPDESSTIDHPTAGRMLGFEATMRLLGEAGIPVAPYVAIGAGDEVDPDAVPFDAPYVVKLADVPHRSDLGAVKVGVVREDLGAVTQELRALAAAHGEAALVAVQPQYAIAGELLVGVNAESELGPLVVCGPGGILVETMQQIAGRLAPFAADEAVRLVDEVNVGGILDGPRGTAPWPKEDLANLLRRVGDLADSAQPWLESLDINPLALTPTGIVAVDGLAILRDVHEPTGASGSGPR